MKTATKNKKPARGRPATGSGKVIQISVPHGKEEQGERLLRTARILSLKGNYKKSKETK